MSDRGFIQYNPYMYRKHTILRRYLGACRRFFKKYRNFAYVDTHGGSGKLAYGQTIDEYMPGSPIIAAEEIPKYPCHIIEIDRTRYLRLRKFTALFPSITCYEGDCNRLVGKILRWKVIHSSKFVLCFVDPDGLKCGDAHQLLWSTVETISNRVNSEILLNFPLEAIFRCGGDFLRNPNESRAIQNGENVTNFFGTDEWINIGLDRRDLLDLYLERLRKIGFRYRGATLVRNQVRAPIYYMIFGSKKDVGGDIMRDIMWKEWGEYLVEQGEYDDFEEYRSLEEKPSSRYFVFEDE